MSAPGGAAAQRRSGAAPAAAASSTGGPHAAAGSAASAAALPPATSAFAAALRPPPASAPPPLPPPPLPHEPPHEPAALNTPPDRAAELAAAAVTLPTPAAAALAAAAAAAPANADGDGVEPLPLLRCRVCFGGPEDGTLIALHCACRGELAHIHDACALKWFRRIKTGTCELCQQPAYDLPAEFVSVSVADDTLSRQARRATGDAHPRARKWFILGSLALTLGLITSGPLGWMVPALHCRRTSMPAGIVPFIVLIGLLHARIYALLPRSITDSWHAVGLLFSVLVLINVSILMTGNGSAWC
jgi:hypothetical protein